MNHVLYGMTLLVSAVVVIALILIAIYCHRMNEIEEQLDWIETIFRQCCQHCAYWQRPEEGNIGWCYKYGKPIKDDDCCIKYDGIDTEVGDGNIDQDDVR